MGQGDRDKGTLQSATKGSAVSCEWNAKQFQSQSRPGCTQLEGSLVRRPTCGPGKDAEQGDLGWTCAEALLRQDPRWIHGRTGMRLSENRLILPLGNPLRAPAGLGSFPGASRAPNFIL